MSECIVGKCPGCHRLVLAIVDDLDRKKDTAKEVARAIREGIEISRMSVEDVRKSDFSCKCEPNPRTAKRTKRQN
jgi:hypothetical protein